MKCSKNMPTPTKEYSLYKPGNLIKTRTDIYSTDPNGKIQEGTVGLILERDNKKRFYVQFLNKVTWWVNINEIEPYIV